MRIAFPPRAFGRVLYVGGVVCSTWIVALTLIHPILAQSLPESVVKAEMIRRFPQFVEWPASVLHGQDDLILCFSAAHPFGAGVDGIAGGPKIQGHAVQVRDLKRDPRIDGCHVLYVAQADLDLLDKLKRRAVLTVGDQKGFCHSGGIINFRLVDGRVRFEVNVGLAKQAGLKFDSQFLRLATALYGEQPREQR